MKKDNWRDVCHLMICSTNKDPEAVMEEASKATGWSVSEIRAQKEADLKEFIKIGWEEYLRKNT